MNAPAVIVTGVPGAKTRNEDSGASQTTPSGSARAINLAIPASGHFAGAAPAMTRPLTPIVRRIGSRRPSFADSAEEVAQE